MSLLSLLGRRISSKVVSFSTSLRATSKSATPLLSSNRARHSRFLSGGSGIGTQNGAYLILVISVATDTIKIERGQFKRSVATVKLVFIGLNTIIAVLGVSLL